MDLQEMVTRSQDTATVGRVYGEPLEKDGATVIPAARISARGGSGAARGGEHSGGGFRADAEPVGAFVIRGRSSGNPSSTSAAPSGVVS